MNESRITFFYSYLGNNGGILRDGDVDVIHQMYRLFRTVCTSDVQTVLMTIAQKFIDVKRHTFMVALQYQHIDRIMLEK